MPSGPGLANVTVRYWAGARAAAGTDSDSVQAATVGEAIARVNALHPGLDSVTQVSSVLLDGHPALPHQRVGEAAVLEVLPPFAGG
jgi:molybdopterin synthase sulfur carrier subunit